MEMEKRLDSERESWWRGLTPEMFSLIIGRIPSDEIARTVPFVARSWRHLLSRPYCWSDIDIEQWCRRCNRTDVIDPVVRRLVRRSDGMIRCISAYKIGYSAFSCLVCYGKHLEVLKIPVSDVSDGMVMKSAATFLKLTVLDISYCLQITCRGLEAIGMHCKALIRLRRNLPPPEFESQGGNPSAVVDEDEAIAIADTMPGLLHLQLAYGRFSDVGLDAILMKCKSLEDFDISGCWNVKLDGNLEDKCCGIKNFVGPWDDELADLESEDSKGSAASSDISD